MDRGGATCVLWLQYEQMRAEPEATIERLAAFLGTPLAPGRVAEIAGLSSFSSMRQHEAIFDHATHAGPSAAAQAGSFVRRGEVGSGSQALSPAQCEAFSARLSHASRRSARLVDLPAFLH